MIGWQPGIPWLRWRRWWRRPGQNPRQPPRAWKSWTIPRCCCAVPWLHVRSIKTESLDRTGHIVKHNPPKEETHLRLFIARQDGRMFGEGGDAPAEALPVEVCLAEQSTMCEILACYILATCFLDAFNVTGFLWPNGECGPPWGTWGTWGN